jgi:hypothetical protein
MWKAGLVAVTDGQSWVLPVNLRCPAAQGKTVLRGWGGIHALLHILQFVLT